MYIYKDYNNNNNILLLIIYLIKFLYNFLFSFIYKIYIYILNLFKKLFYFLKLNYLPPRSFIGCGVILRLIFFKSSARISGSISNPSKTLSGSLIFKN